MPRYKEPFTLYTRTNASGKEVYYFRTVITGIKHRTKGLDDSLSPISLDVYKHNRVITDEIDAWVLKNKKKLIK